MKSAGTTSISIALRSTVVAIFGLILMFMTSPLLSALTLACLPLLLISFRVFSKLNMRYTAEQLTASAQAANVAEECFGSIRTVHQLVTRPLACAACGSMMGSAKMQLAVRGTLMQREVQAVQSSYHVPPWYGMFSRCGAVQVRSFAKEKASTDRYGGAQDQVVKWGLFSARASGFFFGFNSVVGTGSIVFVLWFGARQVPLQAPPIALQEQSIEIHLCQPHRADQMSGCHCPVCSNVLLFIGTRALALWPTAAA